MSGLVVLDTHVLIAYLHGSIADGGKTGSLLGTLREADENRCLVVSAATFWEIELIRRNPRNDLSALPPTDALIWSLKSRGVSTVAINPEIAVQAVCLLDAGFHKDPMDQVITATAISENASLATQDRAIREWATNSGAPRLTPA